MDNSTPFLDQLFWPYMCFAEQLRSLVILMMFGDNIANDTLLRKLHSSPAHQLPDSLLEILATVQLKWLKTPP